MRLIWEDSAHDLRTHSPLFHRRPRQSRGLRYRIDDFARARSRTRGQPCDRSAERDQRYVRSVSASLHSVNEHPYPIPFPAHRHRPLPLAREIGRALDGMLPTKTGDLSVSRRQDRFSGSHAFTMGACCSPNHRTGGPLQRATEPLTPLSRSSLDTGARLSRCARGRFGETRQDRFRPAAVKRRNFSRSEAPSIDERCTALLPPFTVGDCASCAPRTPAFRARFSQVPGHPCLGDAQGRTSHGAIAPHEPGIGFLSPTAPSATRSFAARGFVRKARHQGRDFDARLSSAGQAPVHRVLHSPLGACVRRKGFCEPSRQSTSAKTRQIAYEHIRETASAPASRSRAPCETNVPLAFAWPRTPSPSFPGENAPWAARRESTTEADSLRPLTPSFDELSRGTATDRLS